LITVFYCIVNLVLKDYSKERQNMVSEHRWSLTSGKIYNVLVEIPVMLGRKPDCQKKTTDHNKKVDIK
jgi:hypothetical protein